jgi:hypothetical protein
VQRLVFLGAIGLVVAGLIRIREGQTTFGIVVLAVAIVAVLVLIFLLMRDPVPVQWALLRRRWPLLLVGVAFLVVGVISIYV